MIPERKIIFLENGFLQKKKSDCSVFSREILACP